MSAISASGILKATEVLFRLMDLYEVGTIGWREFNDARNRIEERLDEARNRGRDLTWAEVDEANQELGNAIKRSRT